MNKSALLKVVGTTEDCITFQGAYDTGSGEFYSAKEEHVNSNLVDEEAIAATQLLHHVTEQLKEVSD